MNKVEIPALMEQLREGSISRRGFMRRATALGISAGAAGMMARSAMAQTPMASPAASPVSGEVITNEITREEAQARLDEHFPFEEPQNQGGQFIYQQSTDIETLNTVLTSDTYSSLIAGFIYEGLIGQSVIDGNYEPTALVDSWEISADGIEYTLHLHEGIKWHDGEAFTAEDVAFTFDGALAEDSQSVRKTTVSDILDHYEVVDDLTIKFYSKYPSAIFFSDALGQFGILPKHIWQDVAPGDWPTDPGSLGTDPSRVVGTGPFKFQEWKLGESITLVKNEDYWDTANVPVIDSFVYQIVADANTMVAALQTGSTDMADIPFSQADSLKQSNPDLNIVDYDTLAFNFYHTNQDASKTEFFLDPKVRQAMIYALDRELIAETVYYNYAIRADGTQPVLSIAYDPSAVNTIYNYDPDKAGQLLDEAGWALGNDGVRAKDGQRMSLELIYSEGTSTYPVQIPYMQDAWRAVGIEVITSAVPFQSLTQSTDAGNYQICVQGFSWSVDGGQDAMFDSRMTPPNGFNMMRYSNPEYDALVEPSKREIEVPKRIDILHEMSNIVNDDAAIGINVFRKSISGSTARVHNFFPNGYSSMWWMTRAWLDAI